MVKHLIHRDLTDIDVSYKENTEIFTTTSIDPQMTLKYSNGSETFFFGGRYYIFCDLELHNGHLKLPSIYLDFGRGFGEDERRRVIGKSIAPNQWVFRLSCWSRVKALRFDPSELPVSFSIRWLFLVSERELMMAQATSVISRVARGIFKAPQELHDVGEPDRSKDRKFETSLSELSRTFDFPRAQSVIDDSPSASISDERFALQMFMEEYANRSYAATDGRYYHEYAGLAEDPLGKIEHVIRSIAFYLPQMHPIPENDKWWGRGFTEWNNVSKAVPQFVGHYQPRLPGELGFYDLRVPAVMKRQVELALRYGLYGFCFYYYWFSGKRLLEMPLDTFLSSKSDMNIQFCICWANENWTRRWDGFDQDILIKQEHTEADKVAVFQDMQRYIMDDRYIRIGGMPLLLIYRPDLIPDVSDMIAGWRKAAIDLGLPGLYVISAKAFGVVSASDFGLDGLYSFPPHGITVQYVDHHVRWFDPAHKGHAIYYPDVVNSAIQKIEEAPEDETYDGALVGWDTEARKPGRGEALYGSTPIEFRRWLSAIYAKLRKRPDPEKRIVFINAWNEWAEGAYLEPDRRHGYGFLTALRSVVREYGIDTSSIETRCERYNRATAKQSDYAVIIHMFYFDLLDEIAEHVHGLNADLPVDIIVTVPEIWSVEQVDTLVERLRPHVLLPTKNVGRDVFPFLHACRMVSDFGYTFACKLHTKKSTHRIDGARWRNDLLAGLTSDAALAQLRADFFRHEHAGLAAPANALLPLADSAYIAGNYEHLSALMQMLEIGPFDQSHFVAGTMFWFRFEVFRPIFTLKLDEKDFGIDLGQVDGTLAHAFERLFYVFTESRGRLNVKLESDFVFTIKEQNVFT